MRFNLLLADAGIDVPAVTLLFHNTTLQPLRAQMQTMWAERPDLFAAYQAVHAPAVEATLRRCPVMASFAPLEGGRHLFVGLFDAARWVERPVADIYADPRFHELEHGYGATDTTLAGNRHRGAQSFFDLAPLDALASLRGRLVVATPEGRNYRRLAANLDAPILALSDAPVHEPPMPDWRRLALPAASVRALPRSWAETLSQWRGIYLIVDELDGRRYVGSAYGAENLLGRWRAHVAGELGVTAELRHRPTDRFRFSILERVSPDMASEDVVALEQTWMDRLHTRRFGLNLGGG